MEQRDFLLFRLSGPMAAWGNITVGERRSIWGEPSKSAVLGLVAAAMGVRRTEDDRHIALHQHFGYAVRIDSGGRPMRDYHTAQSPSTRKNLSWRTRKEELANPHHLNTILSERFYRLQASATILLWCKADGGDLADAQQSLREPQFFLSLGRRACPPAEPLFPQIVTALGLNDALLQYDERRRHLDAALPYFARSKAHVGEASIWFDLDAGLAEDVQASPIRQRRDAVRRRSEHSFSDRREGHLKFIPAPRTTDLLEGIVS